MSKDLIKTRAAWNKDHTDETDNIIAFRIHPDDWITFIHKFKEILKSNKKKSKKQKLLPQLILDVSKYRPPRTLAQNDKYWGMLRYACAQEGTDFYGSSPESIHEGVLAVAATQYGYPTDKTFAGLLVPVRSPDTLTDQMSLLIGVAYVELAALGVDWSNYNIEHEDKI